MEKLLLTPDEAAEVLGIGRSKLYQLMRAGTVASVRIGSCRRIPAASLPELIAQLQADAYDGVCRSTRGSVHSVATRPQLAPPRPTGTSNRARPFS